MISYSETLKNLRKKYELTQNQIAQKIGIDRSTYAYYERGDTKPDFECILKLTKLYNMDVDSFAKILMQDPKTKINFKTLDNEEFTSDDFINSIDSLNIDDYEKFILLLYRQTKHKKLFYVKIKQCFDEIAKLENNN